MDSPESTEENQSEASKTAQSGMGAFTEARAYDDQKIFRHLVFYLDTSANAKENNLQISESSESGDMSYAETDKKLYDAGMQLKAGGGSVVENLDEPSLTHIIVSSDTRR